MSEEYLVWQTAPTLAGIKTGSLFPCQYDSCEELKREIRAVNRAVGRKGLRLIPLRWREKQVLLYLYRPERLRADLAAPGAVEILKSEGYDDCREDRCLCELTRRLRCFADFPHEIGLFLSYPPEDVRGFITHRGHESKCAGCWKVYGDAERAQKIFRAYKRCTERYCKRKAAGTPLERLAVVGKPAGDV